MTELTKQQEEYFRVLRSLDSGATMNRVIEDAKDDLRHSGDRVIRGVSRVRGFTVDKNSSTN